MTKVVQMKPPKSGRAKAQETDRYVGARMRQRRIELGLTQQQASELMGVTYQQTHKYEKGINRVAAGRLLTIAQVYGVQVGYFFEGIESAKGTAIAPGTTNRKLLQLNIDLQNLPVWQQEAVAKLARDLRDGNEYAPPPARLMR